jgi:hypothetical protein
MQSLELQQSLEAAQHVIMKCAAAARNVLQATAFLVKQGCIACSRSHLLPDTTEGETLREDVLFLARRVQASARTRTSSTPSSTPNCRRGGSRTFGADHFRSDPRYDPDDLTPLAPASTGSGAYRHGPASWRRLVCKKGSCASLKQGGAQGCQFFSRWDPLCGGRSISARAWCARRCRAQWTPATTKTHQRLAQARGRSQLVHQERRESGHRRRSESGQQATFAKRKRTPTQAALRPKNLTVPALEPHLRGIRSKIATPRLEV